MLVPVSLNSCLSASSNGKLDNIVRSLPVTKYNLSAKTSLSDDSPLLVITLSVADVDILGPEDLSSRWAVPLDDCKGSKICLYVCPAHRAIR